jgi:hypothetical protein
MLGPTTGSSLTFVRPRRLLRLRNIAIASALGLTLSLLPATSAFAESGPGSEGTGGLVEVTQTAVTTEATASPEVPVDQSLATTQEAAGDPVEVEQTAATTASCQDPVIVNPFTAFGDFRDYVLAPFGDFEQADLPGWILDGGAAAVRNAAGNGILRMPPGSTATSPAMCIDLNYPTIRYFVRNALYDGARLQTQVMYVDHETAYLPYTVAKLTATKNWRLTEDIEIEPERGGEEAGWRRIAFRFVADRYLGDIRIDDLYVDPRMR